jgi:hypothetical protein
VADVGGGNATLEHAPDGVASKDELPVRWHV